MTQQPQQITKEEALFKKHVGLFVEQQREKQARLLAAGTRSNQNLADLIKKTIPLEPESLDIFFNQEEEVQVPEGAVEEVRESFGAMMEKINSLKPIKRFFILETMDFFRSKISIGKLIPALLLLEGEDQKRAICEFIRPTFTSINKNVEILTSTNELFDTGNIHLERASLYSFVSDIAKVLIQLFKPNYKESFEDVSSPVELMLRILDSSSLCKTAEESSGYDDMIDSPDEIRRVIIEFVQTIQSHEALFNYSLKRHGYYKLFLQSLTQPGRFKGVAPFDVSRIFAGCLLANNQIMPPEPLIDAMVDPERYNHPQTVRERAALIDQLAPTTVFNLIHRIRTTLQHFSKANFGTEFQQVARLNVRSILKRVWTGFIRLAEEGFKAATEPVTLVFKQIKKVYINFVDEERKREAKLQKAPATTKKRDLKDIYVPKLDEAIEMVEESFNFVETDVIAFRGEFDGASQKDFGYNARLFGQDEVIQVRFQFCFERFFKAQQRNDKIKVVEFKTQKRIVEYYSAIAFGDQMICVGLTHQKRPDSTLIQEKDIFPYVLLFKKAPEKTFGRVLSRQIRDEGYKGWYGEESLTGTNAKVFYESLYMLLHMLPEKDWKSRDAQACVQFLITEMQKSADDGPMTFLQECPSIPDE